VTHSSAVDPGIVIEGELILELDNGVQKRMTKSDIVVQQGT
jgi:hypothetical protein